MRKANGTLSDLTLALNAAITELAAPVTPADGTLVSATAQLRALLTWAGSSLTTDGTLAGDTGAYNTFVDITPFPRFYLLPIERNGNGRGPKYFAWRGDPDPPGLSCPWNMKDYGSIDMAVLAANILQADHDALILNADVYTFPINLAPAMVLAQRQAMNTYLEAHGIPGDWLGPGDTFLYSARIIAAMFLYLQRTLAILGYPADPFAGLTLNTRYNQLTVEYQNAMSQAATDLGYTWDVAANDQIRKIWKMMADQWGTQPIYFNFTEL